MIKNKNVVLSIFSFMLMVVFLANTNLAQQKPDSTKNMHHMNHSKMMQNISDSTHHSQMKSHKMMDSSKHGKINKKSSIVRKEPIDVKAIDKNKDGKVYQDVMDWNVIADSSDKCPVCGMNLKEVSVEEAIKNLIKNGFKVVQQ